MNAFIGRFTWPESVEVRRIGSSEIEELGDSASRRSSGLSIFKVIIFYLLAIEVSSNFTQ